MHSCRIVVMQTNSICIITTKIQLPVLPCLSHLGTCFWSLPGLRGKFPSKISFLVLMMIRNIIALCLVASAFAAPVEWHALDTRESHLVALETAQVKTVYAVM